jgi:hypothetical protein
MVGYISFNSWRKKISAGFGILDGIPYLS